MATPGVDFFRVDRSASTKRLLIVAAGLTALGASAIGAHLMHRLSFEVSFGVSLAGGVTMVFGLLLGFVTMGLMLFEDVYLAIRDEGVLVHDNGKQTTIAWDALERIYAEPDAGIVVLEERAGTLVRFFVGKDTGGVVRNVQEAQRKARHGMRRTSSVPPRP